MSATVTDGHVEFVGPPEKPTAVRFRVYGMRLPCTKVDGNLFERLHLAFQIIFCRPVNFKTGPSTIELLASDTDNPFEEAK